MFPAVPDRAGPIGPGGDRRPTILALVMLALYALLTAMPGVREFFDLVALPLETTALLLAYTALFSAGIFGLQHVAGRYRSAARRLKQAAARRAPTVVKEWDAADRAAPSGIGSALADDPTAAAVAGSVRPHFRR